MNKIRQSVTIALIMFMAGVASACSQSVPLEGSIKKAPKVSNSSTKDVTSNFAQYKEVKVKVKPSVPLYTIKTDLSNVVNRKDFDLEGYADGGAVKLLAKNAFVVLPSWHNEFFPLYESNRYNGDPSFVTTDSILHNYHLVFDYLLKNMEEQKLIPALKKLNTAMIKASMAQYDEVKGSAWENAAKRNVGFFAVANKLVDPSFAVPDLVKQEVEQELELIKKHEGITSSPLMNLGAENASDLNALKEDYSQYIPRGHYDKTEELKKYFKSMMWYGRLTFRFKNDDEIRSALLITQSLGDKKIANIWESIYEPTSFFVGVSDDVTFYQFQELIKNVYGNAVAVKQIVSAQDKFPLFVKAAQKLNPPQINSVPVFNSKIEPDRTKAVSGFRFMGQRFVMDAAIFQRLIDREVPGRMLPKSLDVPAAMGSKEALNLLKESGDTSMENYSANMTKLKAYLSGLSQNIWTQNLYWGWLYSLNPLTVEKTEGYPLFMKNLAWARKELNTYLGSWTELKHDTILYAKQAYAEMGGGPSPDEAKDDRGYVEPNPLLYARLAALLKMTEDGLNSRGLLTEEAKDNLGKMQTLALSLEQISEKELGNLALSVDDYELIRSYGGQLEHFWYEVNKEEMNGSTQDVYLNKNPAAIVADVATDPNGQVLEEATGNVFQILVIVPIEGKLKIAKGAVYSYYEFPWPLNDRLTDTKWREELKNNSEKFSLPEWTKEFIPQPSTK